MTRPILWSCDGCGVEVRTDNYGMPKGWIWVKAIVKGHAEAHGDYCADCAFHVDAVALAESGREVQDLTAKKRKPKADPELELEA